jgi:Mrp family chromosome partitioning ATPase/capsular polysaccharide biosynthesis protein
MNGTTDASAIFAPIWRRKWLILAVGILVSVGAYYHYKKSPTKFAVKTQLYLGATSESQALGNNTLGKSNLSATALANQAALINSAVAETVRKKFRAKHDGAAVKAKVKAKVVASSDFIQLTAEAHTPKAASDAANAYAVEYIKRHRANYELAVKTAIATTEKQIHRIEAAALAARAKSSKGGGSSNATTLQTAALRTKLNQLESDLSVAGVQQIGPARPAKAELLGPHPKQNAIFGFVIGLLLAAMAAAATSRLNRRLRTLDDIESAFGVPILSVLPISRTPIVRRDGQVRLSRLLSEAMWRLQTSLRPSGDSGLVERKTILLVSADAGDGKSTVAAGLALVERDANRRAVLVEADFRRPVQAKLLGLTTGEGSRGLADVLSGSMLPLGAMQRVAASAPPEQAPAGGGVATAVSPSGGSLSVLTGATGVANPPALLATVQTGQLLRSLSGEFDTVVVDAPSPLQVSDVMPLLAAVDGIVIVARPGHTRQISAQRLMELLRRTAGAEVLGVVVNAVSTGNIEKYGFVGVGGRRRWPMRLFGP